VISGQSGRALAHQARPSRRDGFKPARGG